MGPLPHFNCLSDWARARHGYVALDPVDHVHAPSTGVLIDWRWEVSVYEACGELAGQACAEEIEHAAEYICSDLGIGEAAPA